MTLLRLALRLRGVFLMPLEWVYPDFGAADFPARLDRPYQNCLPLSPHFLYI